jgi:hypothetical protein
VAAPFSALRGCSFASVIDELALGWRRSFGFIERGLVRPPISGTGPLSEEEERAIQENHEIARKFAPILAALRAGTLVLVGIDGPVPLRVWFAGKWIYRYDEARAVDWLEVQTETGAKAEYYSPRFAGKVRSHRAKGSAAPKKKTKPASIAAGMVAWLDSLPAGSRRNKSANALADQYLSDPSRRGSKRHACEVFGNPHKYRGRSVV